MVFNALHIYSGYSFLKSGLTITKIVKNEGIETDKIMKLLSKKIKEKDFRKSKIGFGLVMNMLKESLIWKSRWSSFLLWLSVSVGDVQWGIWN